MRTWLLSSLVGLLLGCLAVQAAELSVLAGRGRPVLDGKLDDACWREAQWQGGFLTNETARPAVNQTRFAVCWDDQGLYLGVQCPQPAPPVVSAKAASEEGAIYGGDVVELFLQPGGDNRIYYHFTADSAGNRYDAKVFEEGGSLSDDVNWGACWQARGARTADGWSLECAIPWDTLPLVPEQQREWRLNVGRENVSEPREIVSWCHGDFAHRESFGHLTGLSPDLSKYMISVGPATVRRQYTMSGSEIAYVVDLANPPPQPVKLAARLTEESPRGRVLGQADLSLPPGGSATLSLALQEAPAPRTALCLQVLDPDGSPRATRLSRVGVQHASPMRLKLTRPAFRHTIYPTEKLTRIEGAVSVAATPEVLAKAKLTAVVTNGTVPISRQTIQPVKSDNAIALPVRAMADGTYQLRVSLDIAGQEREALTQPITKVGPGPTEVRVDEQGRLVLRGKPIFPILIYSTDMSPEGLRELKAAGFNIAHSYYMGYYFPPEKCPENFGPILDTAAQEGMPVLDYALANKSYGAKDYIMPPSLATAIPGIQRQIHDLKGKPALLFWGLGEEFHSTGEDQAKGLQAVYDTICASDPYRPAYVGDYAPECLALEMRSADVGILWSYPDFYRAGGNRVALDQLASRFEQLWPLMGGYRSKPIIGMPQLFNFGSGYPQGYAARRAPNHFEMRSMTYQALVHGAAGIGYYDAFAHEAWPGAWTAVKYLGRELSALTPVLLEPDGKPVVKVAAGKVDVLCKQHGGDWYVFTVARSDKPQTARFLCAGPPSLKVAGEGREVSLQGGQFQDHFRPYEARLYTTSKQAWNLPSLQDIMAECDQADADQAEREKDNLACFTHGSYFEAEGDVYHLAQINDSWDGDGGPYLNTPATLRLTTAQTLNTVVVAGKLLERWAKPDIQAWADGRWQSVEMISSKLEKEVQTVTFKPVTTDQVKFTFPGVYVNEIRAYNR